MEIDTIHVDGITVVAPTGDLDAHTADLIRGTLKGLVADGHVRLVVDLSGVPYLDSSGLGAIVQAMKQARTAHGDLRLCALRDDVRAILNMTGLMKQIAVHANRSAAVAAWQLNPMPAPLEVDRTEFLVSTREAGGTWTTIASNVVPLRPGRSSYRWRICLRAAELTSIALKEVLTVAAPSEFWPSDPAITIQNDGRTAITKRTVNVENGWVSNGWRVAKGDRPGQYAIDVHLNGVFVQRFVFYVR